MYCRNVLYCTVKIFILYSRIFLYCTEEMFYIRKRHVIHERPATSRVLCVCYVRFISYIMYVCDVCGMMVVSFC